MMNPIYATSKGQSRMEHKQVLNDHLINIILTKLLIAELG